MSFIRHRRWIGPIAAAAAIGIALTACTGDIAAEDAADADCGDYEAYGTFDDGTEVSIYGTIIDVEADRLNESWADFETCTGIDVVYEAQQGVRGPDQRARAGRQPAEPRDLPAAGPARGLRLSDDYIMPAPEAVEANAEEFWTEDWQAYGTVDDTFYGAPLMASVKGFVWYSPIDVRGERLGGSRDARRADRRSPRHRSAERRDMPWCVGFGSGDATGWPGTDWVEDFVLRQARPEVYDQWVTHEIPFTDPQIVEARSTRSASILRTRTTSTAASATSNSIVDDRVRRRRPPDPRRQVRPAPPGLVLRGLLARGHDGRPGRRRLGLPHSRAVEAGANAVTGGGEFVGAFSDADEVAARARRTSPATMGEQPRRARRRDQRQQRVSTRRTRRATCCSRPSRSCRTRTPRSASTRSDLMPGAVGAGSFWKGMVDWIGGKSTADTIDSHRGQLAAVVAAVDHCPSIITQRGRTAQPRGPAATLNGEELRMTTADLIGKIVQLGRRHRGLRGGRRSHPVLHRSSAQARPTTSCSCSLFLAPRPAPARASA